MVVVLHYVLGRFDVPLEREGKLPPCIHVQFPNHGHEVELVVRYQLEEDKLHRCVAWQEESTVEGIEQIEVVQVGHCCCVTCLGRQVGLGQRWV